MAISKKGKYLMSAAKRLQLNREFSNQVSNPVDEDWSRFFSEREPAMTWETLKDRPVVVVLGEAGVARQASGRAKA